MQLGAVEAALSSPSPVSSRRRNYILALLLIAGTLNFLDRNVMSILIEPIRRDLNLTDTQMGFLTGIAFTLTYATLTIPAARLADRWSRRKVITIAILIWSVMTMLCGVATSAASLLVARFGVGF